MALGSSHGLTVSSAILVLVLYVFTFNNSHAANLQGSNGFSLKLIPKYSRASPMNPGNLTDVQRYVKILDLSRKRSFRLASQRKYASMNISTRNMMTPRVGQVLDSVYIVSFFIGSPPQMFNLDLDTGSSQSWLQCSGCHPCFDLDGGSFEYFKSNTYKWLSCDDPYCIPKRCFENKCRYKTVYYDKSVSVGILSRDDFSNTHEKQIVQNVVFGCGYQNTVTWGKNNGPDNEIAGILGMGKGPLALVAQLGEQGKGRFSYCLNHWRARNGGVSFLRFGDEADHFPLVSDVKSTPLIDGPDPEYYYVNLFDISVNGKSINVPPGTFQINNNKGGMIVDTGFSQTMIFEEAYWRLKMRLSHFFQSLGLQFFDPSRIYSDWTELKFCFYKPNGFYTFPIITFHFEGADFTLEPEAAFVIFDHFFCLQIQEESQDHDDAVSILGAFSMTNHVFVHDIRAGRLSFAKANCLVDS